MCVCVAEETFIESHVTMFGNALQAQSVTQPLDRRTQLSWIQSEPNSGADASFSLTPLEWAEEER